MNKTRLTQTELEALIDRYFEAETSEQEEALLKKMLVSGYYRPTPIVDDALAVMSLTARKATHRRRRHKFYTLAGIAASLAIIFTVALHIHYTGNVNSCEMYIAGVRVSDQNLVMASIEDDLRELSAASSASTNVVDEELSNFINLVY